MTMQNYMDNLSEQWNHDCIEIKMPDYATMHAVQRVCNLGASLQFQCEVLLKWLLLNSL